MPTLLRVHASADWKHRPSQTVVVVGTGTEEELLALQNSDVAIWQAEEIAQDKQMALEEAEEGEEPAAVSDEWENRERWEMVRGLEHALGRIFAGHTGGEPWSIGYHIVPTLLAAD